MVSMRSVFVVLLCGHAVSQSVFLNPNPITTTEGGVGVQFTATLTGGPVSVGGNVFLDYTVQDTTEASMSPTRMTFTNANWNLPQTGTITGLADNLVDANIVHTIITSLSSVTDTAFNGIAVADITVTNVNVDTATVNVQVLTNPMITTEAGGDADFQMTLSAAPTQPVTITVTSSDTTEGTVSVTSVTFTATSWNVAQVVKVTGVNDAVDDGDVAYSITFGTSFSADSNFNGLVTSAIGVTNLDDDTRGFDVSPVVGTLITTDESGRSAVITVSLLSEPTAAVNIAVSSSDTTEATVAPSSLTFFPTTYSTPQMITVTGVDDVIADGNVNYIINLLAATGGDYAGQNPVDVQGVNNDNDVAGISINPPEAIVAAMSTLQVVEGVVSSTAFTLVLDTQPSGTVRIPISVSDASEGVIISPATGELTFSTTSWNLPQSVTVQSVDDNIIDGDITFFVVIGAAVGGGYDGIKLADNAYVKNIDNDIAAVVYNSDPTVTASSLLLSLAEADVTATAEFTLMLASQPNGGVTFPIASSDVTEGTVSASSVTFTPSTWNVPQTIRLTAVDERIDDGDQNYFVTISTPSSAPLDPLFLALDPDDVPALTVDNDVAAITIVQNPLALNTNQRMLTYEVAPGGTAVASMQVSLTSEPIGDILFSLAVSDGTEATIDKALLRFTPVTWEQPQTIVLNGVDDNLDDGNQLYVLNFGPATAGANDQGYAGMTALVNGENVDDDTAAVIYLTPKGDNTVETSENGAAQKILFSLSTQPSANVVLNFAMSDITEASLSTTSLTFTPTDYLNSKELVVTGVDDILVDGSAGFVLTVNPSSADSVYNALTSVTILGTNLDNDTPGFVVSPTKLETVENGNMVSFSITLLSQPSSDVNIAVSSGDTTEGVVSTNSLTFLPATWNIPKNVSVTPVSDQTADGDQTYFVLLSSSMSVDPNYNSLNILDVEVLNRNVDTAGFLFAGTTNALLTGESGVGNANTPKVFFSVVLRTKPLADVSLRFASSDATEGVPTPETVIFRVDTWNTPQTVFVNAVDDLINDGDISYVIQGTITTTDTFYSALSIADIAVTNIDDDQPGVQIGAIDDPNNPSYYTIENSGKNEVSITVLLRSQPLFSVGFTVVSGDLTEGVVVDPLGGAFTIQPAEWNVGKTIIMRSVDDFVIDGNVTYPVELRVVSSRDAGYAGLAKTFFVTNRDDDVARVSVDRTNTAAALIETSASNGLKETFFTVKLTAEPTSDVTIPITTGNAGKLATSPTSLLFSTTSWATAQNVRVFSLNNNIADNNEDVSIRVGPSTSGDASFQNMLDDTVVVNVANDDLAGILVSPTALTTSESSNAILNQVKVFTAANTPSFSVQLNSEPTRDVRIALSSSDINEGLILQEVVGSSTDITSNAIERKELTFTNTTWNVAQLVSLAGVDDDVVDGTKTFTIVLGDATSADPIYSGFQTTDVTVSNLDNDTAGVFVTPLGGHFVSEDGNTSSFTVQLTSRPLATVSITLGTDDSTEGFAQPSTLSFPPGNWNVPQTANIRGVDDIIPDGNIIFGITVGPSRSTDGNYENRPVTQISVVNVDNDPPATFTPVIPFTLTPPQTAVPVTATPPLTTLPPNVVTPETSSDDDLPDWLIALLVVGALLLCSLCAAVGFLLFRSKGEKKETTEAKKDSTTSQDKLSPSETFYEESPQRNPMDNPLSDMGFDQQPPSKRMEPEVEIIDMYDVNPIPANDGYHYSQPLEYSPGRQSLYGGQPTFSQDVVAPSGYPSGQPDVIVLSE